jgi:hypothetical protein
VTLVGSTLTRPGLAAIEEGIEMYSVILGWVLVILGVVSYLVALALLVREQFLKKEERALPAFESLDLEGIGKLLENLAKAIENFSRLSVPVQWAFLGLVNIGIGAYLIANAPF